ncbi:VCBS repeat-containing protein [Flavivirga amylovorans]|uniref:VCBS repeat-containing protein n=1 Tax=Flavivirga amylovorans TaxID=870486 RepID=A0ABT8X285_9FLAO|nr:VCBS repeat-containing protein [Flavivirga amylovorans]MDO5988063.1 VCBS repeat-containing protein [Flavivirga amylovorans]
MKIIYTSFVFLFLVLSCKKQDIKQFNLLTSDKTGILFSNDIVETDSLNYFNYPYMYMGGGVSAGDINNDGLIDLFFTANMKSNMLYLNKGDFVFEDITSVSGVAGDDRWVTGTTMVDINNDGYLDIYVSVSGKGNNRNNLLYVNNGDTTFTEKSKTFGIDHNGHTTQSTFFDYDNDGDLDLYLANYPPTPFKSPVELYQHKSNHPKIEESDILYRNNGDGSFTDVTIESGILNFGLSLSATIADFNNDGWKDIYVSNDFDSADYLYINSKNSTFTEIAGESVNHTAQYGMGADVADYNNDNLIDIAQVDMTPEDNRRSKANMASMNPVGFTKMVNAGLNYQYMQNCLQLNRGTDANGNPIFSEVSRLAGISTTDWSWSILFADLDNDGWKDVTISNGTRRDINNRDYFKKLKSRNHFGGVKLSAAEIEQIPSEKVSNYIYKNTKDYTFKNMVSEWGWEEKTFSNGAIYADLDNDGDLDYVINNIDQEASIYRNNNLDKNNYLQVTLKGSEKNKNGLGTKVYVSSDSLEQYNELTLSRGFQSSVAPQLHFGLGKTENISMVKVVWPNGSISEIKNVKANQNMVVDFSSAINQSKERFEQPTIFETVALDSLQVDFKHSENNYNDYYFEPLLPHKTSMLGSGVAVADVNGDGLEDFYIGGSSQQAGALFIQNSKGKFDKTNHDVWDIDKAREDMSALFFDADSDGDQDLYVVSGGNEKSEDVSHYQDRLYINNGQGKFTKAEHNLPEIVTSGSRVKAGDYDGDGDLDLFVGGRLVAGQYPWPTKSYILNNDKGFFKDVTSLLAPDFETLGMITDAVWTDFDANGTLDLIIVGEWTPILFYSNTDGAFKNVTESIGLENTNGWWSSLIQNDFDNDGDIDYVVGNLGLNYKYKATIEEPFEVYADDFDDNKRKDIVLSYYNFGKLFPVRGKSCSSQQIPSLNKKFENYSSFAVAEVTEVYGKGALSNAEIHYKAQTFASSYIENLGTGKFKLTKLPNEAQFSSVNRIITDDIDNDGFKDVLIAGNLYASEIETPRNDSSIGTYLKGDGHGNFLPVPNKKCGLFIRGDVKDLTSINIGGHKYIIAVKNNDYPQFIKII